MRMRWCVCVCVCALRHWRIRKIGISVIFGGTPGVWAAFADGCEGRRTTVRHERAMWTIPLFIALLTNPFVAMSCLASGLAQETRPLGLRSQVNALTWRFSRLGSSTTLYLSKY